MMRNMNEEMHKHFKMMDEVMNKLNDRDDWARLEFHDWSTMTPHSFRLSTME